jgi:hypothetical protein
MRSARPVHSDPEDVRRDGQPAGDTGQRATVGDAATAALDHGNVGAVKVKQIGQLLLGQPAGMPVGTQDRPQITKGLAAPNRSQPGRRSNRRARRRQPGGGNLASRTGRRVTRG